MASLGAIIRVEPSTPITGTVASPDSIKEVRRFCVIDAVFFARPTAFPYARHPFKEGLDARCSSATAGDTWVATASDTAASPVAADASPSTFE